MTWNFWLLGVFGVLVLLIRWKQTAVFASSERLSSMIVRLCEHPVPGLRRAALLCRAAPPDPLAGSLLDLLGEGFATAANHDVIASSPLSLGPETGGAPPTPKGLDNGLRSERLREVYEQGISRRISRVRRWRMLAAPGFIPLAAILLHGRLWSTSPPAWLFYVALISTLLLFWFDIRAMDYIRTVRDKSENVVVAVIQAFEAADHGS